MSVEKKCRTYQRFSPWEWAFVDVQTSLALFVSKLMVEFRNDLDRDVLWWHQLEEGLAYIYHS